MISKPMIEDLAMSLDAAYERRAMQQGLVTAPVFSENKTKVVPKWEQQPPPKANNYPEAWNLVLVDMSLRNEVGRFKYGTPLQPFNGRNALQDAYEEALDLCVYLRTALYEKTGK